MAKLILDPCKCAFFTDGRPESRPRFLDEAKVYISEPGGGIPISRTLHGDAVLTVKSTTDMDEVARQVRAWHDAYSARCLAPKGDA